MKLDKFKRFLAYFVCKQGKKCIYGIKRYRRKGKAGLVEGYWENGLIKCPYCHQKTSKELSYCQNCGNPIRWPTDYALENIEVVVAEDVLPSLVSGSSIVTTKIFDKVVDAFGDDPYSKVEKKKFKEQKISDDAIGILISLDFIVKSGDYYEFTDKGMNAYNQNKKFRKKIKELIDAK